MQDAQTPQQALDIARTTTRHAREAAAPSGWIPFAAGAFGGLTAVLTSTAFGDGASNPAIWVGAIVSGSVFVALVWWLSRTARARGIVPRSLTEQPVVQWKQSLLLVLPPLLIGAVAALGVDSGWWRLVTGVVLGGWLWFGLSRRWPVQWKK
ncbi:hypothetical protein [Nocardia sp. NBC_01329]|uniref:hypothetical protein n=1 Tax=Nocardia sp. NBC_01329 TaxID=2903594 RepID=UPI002E14273A|nr:hypothetical protein OG405_09905 [Nocardia sp. NBC_01329]